MTADESDDLPARVAVVEATISSQNVTIRDLKYELTKIREIVSDIRRDIHGARMAGRVGLGIALILGSFIAWIVSVVAKV
jgi:hypothetical protein